MSETFRGKPSRLASAISTCDSRVITDIIPAARWIDRYIARRMPRMSATKLELKLAKNGIALIRDKVPALSPVVWTESVLKHIQKALIAM